MKKRKKSKSKLKKITPNKTASSKYLHLYIDIPIFSIIVILIILTNLFCRPSNISIPFFDLVSLLLPLIDTILSISLSINNDKIYGLKRNELYCLRTGIKYDFKSIICVTIGLLGLTFVCYCLPCKFTIYILNIFCVFYSILFCVIEIPFICNDYNKFNKVLRNYYYKVIETSCSSLKNEEQNYFYNSIINMIYSVGIKSAYINIKKQKNDTKLLCYLIDIQNNLIYELKTKINFLYEFNQSNYEDIQITDIVNKTYENIIDLLDFSSNFIEYNEEVIDLLVGSLLLISDCANSLNDEQTVTIKNKEIVNKILLNIIRLQDKQKTTFGYRFLIGIIASSLTNGETNFLSDFINCDYKGIDLNYDLKSLEYLFMVFCYYLINECRFNNNKINKKIETFCNTPVNKNTDRKWKEEFSIFIEKNEINLMPNLLIKWLEFFKMCDRSMFSIAKINDETLLFYDYLNFDESYIINIWLELLIYHQCIFIDNNEFNVLKTWLNKNNYTKDIFIKVLNEKLFEKGKVTLKKHDNYYKFIQFLEYSVDSKLLNSKKMIIELLTSYRDKEIFEKINIQLNPDIQVKEDNIIMNNCFNTIFKRDGIVKLVNIEEEVAEKTIVFRWTSMGNEKYALYTAMIKREIYPLIYRSVNNKIINNEITSCKIQGNKLPTKLINLHPEYMSSWIDTNQFVQREDKKLLNNLKVLEKNLLPKNLFWKNGAIDIKIQFVPEKTNICNLSAKQIEDEISLNYPPIDGLYKYSTCESDTIFISREQLFNILKVNLHQYTFIYKLSIEIDCSKIIHLEINKN